MAPGLWASSSPFPYAGIFGGVQELGNVIAILDNLYLHDILWMDRLDKTKKLINIPICAPMFIQWHSFTNTRTVKLSLWKVNSLSYLMQYVSS